MSNDVWTVALGATLRQNRDGYLRCPACGCADTHLTHAISADQGRRSVAVNYRGNLGPAEDFPYSVGRRPSFAIVGHCEAGHAFTISFMQHKGSTEVHVCHTDDPTELERQDPHGRELGR